MRKHAVTIKKSKSVIYNSDAMECYGEWPEPTVIMVDGPYGIGGFPGDPRATDALPSWYAPHIAEWSRRALPSTTLWFWGTELGWSKVNPLLETNGWNYEQAFIWNKGISHVAGNVNSLTIRSAPVVTEICVRYSRKATLKNRDGEPVPLKEWLRDEWERTGIPFSRTNEACGVKNAATRKYFTKDGLWYFPPADAMMKLAGYANENGNRENAPYFNIRGKELTPELWNAMRPKWHHEHGTTNVWNVPPLHSRERLRNPATGKALHNNQKPAEIIDYIVRASSDPGDTVWDPFCGLATTAACCLNSGRDCYSAEIDENTFNAACKRVDDGMKENKTECA